MALITFSNPDYKDKTVYAVAGSSGKISGGLLNHPAMFISMSELGSMVLEVYGDRLDAAREMVDGGPIDVQPFGFRDKPKTRNARRSEPSGVFVRRDIRAQAIGSPEPSDLSSNPNANLEFIL